MLCCQFPKSRFFDLPFCTNFINPVCYLTGLPEILFVLVQLIPLRGDGQLILQVCHLPPQVGISSAMLPHISLFRIGKVSRIQYSLGKTIRMMRGSKLVLPQRFQVLVCQIRLYDPAATAQLTMPCFRLPTRAKVNTHIGIPGFKMIKFCRGTVVRSNRLSSARLRCTRSASIIPRRRDIVYLIGLLFKEPVMYRRASEILTFPVFYSIPYLDTRASSATACGNCSRIERSVAISSFPFV